MPPAARAPDLELARRLAERLFRPRRSDHVRAVELAARCDDPAALWRLYREHHLVPAALGRGDWPFFTFCDACGGRGRTHGGEVYDDSDACDRCQELGGVETPTPATVEQCVSLAADRAALHGIERSLAEIQSCVGPRRVRWTFGHRGPMTAIPTDDVFASRGNEPEESKPLVAAFDAAFDAAFPAWSNGAWACAASLRYYLCAAAHHASTKPFEPNPFAALLQIWECGYAVFPGRLRETTSAPLSLAVRARKDVIDIWVPSLATDPFAC